MASTLFEVEPGTGAELQLPPIEGTEKQTPWAEHVRGKLLAEVRKLLRDWEGYVESLRRSGKDAKAEAEADALRQARGVSEELHQQARASFWLDRRENTARELITGAPPRPGGLVRS